MKKVKLTSLFFSDVHLFHDKTKTEHILFGFYDALPDTKVMDEVDIIVITGDLFDRSVSFPNPDVSLVYRFISYLLNICAKYDIVLRILEGTPSHDWQQSKILDELNNLRDVPVDAKHVNQLSIEHIDKLGIDVLYVPDEWRPECSQTYTEVCQLLAQKGLQQVDFCYMHGVFGFQFPVNLVGKPDTHDEESYMRITKQNIIIGHHHRHNQFGSIVVPGSFDRLRHGEEEPKGYIKMVNYLDGSASTVITFIENKNAMMYKTLDCAGKTVQDVIKTIVDICNGSTEEKFIRIIANKDDPVYSGIKELKGLFPFIHFSINPVKKEKEALVAETKDIIRPTVLTPEHLLELMSQRLYDKCPEKAQSAIELLEGVIRAN